MTTLVLKFGGTSVANIARLEHAASIVQKEIKNGNQIVVVVSAMAGVTNQFVSYLHQLCPTKITAEHDVVLSSGEQITVGLMALALQNLNIKSRSFLSWQIPILTDISHTSAKITQIHSKELKFSLNKGMVPIVAGFQGLSSEGRITTLGRGGSDTTAVALSALLHADRCDIYTDVDGVYTADPRLIPHARRLSVITYAEMFEMAAQGAKVLQARSVELAMKHHVPLRVLSSFVEGEGTLIVKDRLETENKCISGIAHSQEEAKIKLSNLPDETGVAAKLFGPLAKESISVDFIVQTHTIDGRADLSFTVPLSDLDRAIVILESIKTDVGFDQIISCQNIAKISIIGAGLKSNYETASVMFKTLADEDINIQSISTSEIKISVIIQKEYMFRAIVALHKTFNLDVNTA